MTVAVAPGRERSRDLVRELLVRSVRLRYRRSVLGLAWTQIGPLCTMAVLSVVFMRVIPLGIQDYPVFLYVGLTSWQWFQSGISSATASVVSNRDLVRQPGFPIQLLPPIEVGSQFVHYVLALPVLVGAVVFTGNLGVTATALPLILAVQFLLCVGCGYLLAAVHVTVRDTAQIVGIGLRLLFYGTPIMYDEGRIIGTRFEFLYDYNPIAHLLTAQRDVLLRGRWPDFSALAVVALIAVVLTIWGSRRFAVQGPRFPDEV